jgi:hypothetical protein
MEFLKGIISDELYTQLSEALKDKKDVKLGNLAGGEYVGKGKFDAQTTENGGLKTQLKDANKQIEDFKGMDVEGIKKAADDWKIKAEKAESDAQKQISEMQFSHALETELSKAGARNPKTIKALLDMDKLKNVDGNIIGLKDQMDNLKKDESYLFNESSNDDDLNKTKVTVNSGGSHGGAAETEFEKMSDAEYYTAMAKKDKK